MRHSADPDPEPSEGTVGQYVSLKRRETANA
jgi:hypothetical protein